MACPQWREVRSTLTPTERMRYMCSLTGHAFFLDAVCRAPYTVACSHALPRRQCAPPGPCINLTGDADTDSAHGLLHYSRESAALVGVDNTFREKSEEVA